MQAYPPFIKFSSSIGSTDSFFKINTDSLFLDGDSKAFSHFESLCRKTLLGTETRPLQYAYHDIEGDLILLASEGAFLIALGDCRKDSLKVFVHELSESFSINAKMSPSVMEQSVSNLQNEGSALQIASEKYPQPMPNLDIQSTLRPPPGFWEPHNEFSIPKPNRIALQPSMAYLLSKECILESDRIAFFGCEAAAVFDLSTINAGLYRAVIEIADCHNADGICFAGIIEGDYSECHSMLQQKSYDALQKLFLPVSPRSRKALTTTTKMIIPLLQIEEETWPNQKVKGLQDEWVGLMNGVKQSQDVGPKFVVEEPQINFESFVDGFLDSTMPPSQSIAEDMLGQGPTRRRVYTKFDLLRFQKHPTCTERPTTLPSHHPIIEVPLRRERTQVELEVLPSRRGKRR